MGRRNEDGQALLLALAFLMIFGLVITGLTYFAGSSALATANLRKQRNVTYTADGGADGAIAYIGSWVQFVGGSSASCTSGGSPALCGAYGTTCPTFTWTSTGDTGGALTTNVTCQVLTQPLDLDRTIRFEATVPGSTVGSGVVATVIYRDPSGSVVTCSVTPCVSVQSWAFCRAGVNTLANPPACKPST
jgi:hypothetical protein